MSLSRAEERRGLHFQIIFLFNIGEHITNEKYDIFEARRGGEEGGPHFEIIVIYINSKIIKMLCFQFHENRTAIEEFDIFLKGGRWGPLFQIRVKLAYLH